MYVHVTYVTGFGKPSMYAQKLKSNLLLIIIATLKHSPDAVTKLL